MPDTAWHERLNLLLIEEHRSLLQYVGECWPWTQNDAAAVRAKIDELVRRQQRQIAELTELLSSRGWAVSFGTYPTEYTDLHFLALEFLLAQLIANQSSLVGSLDEVIASAADDPAAVRLLGQSRAEEQNILQELEELARSRATAKAVMNDAPSV